MYLDTLFLGTKLYLINDFESEGLFCYFLIVSLHYCACSLYLHTGPSSRIVSRYPRLPKIEEKTRAGSRSGHPVT